MTVKRNNRLFLYCMLLVDIGQTALAVPLNKAGWGLYALIPYLVCLLIAFLMFKKDGTPFLEAMPYNVVMKPVTAVLCVLLVFALSPLSNALAALGARFGGDALSLAEQVMLTPERSLAEELFEIALIPAVFEEMLFRGFFYAGFKRARGTRCAILLTAVLFGLFHMNLQQIAYAVALGLFIAVIRELTGSMWPGMLFHFVNNGLSVIVSSQPEDSFLLRLPIERVTFTEPGGVPVYDYVMLVICTALAVLILYGIARAEGRTECLKRFFPRAENENRGKLVTTAFVLGCVLLVLGTVLMTFVLNNLDGLVPAGGF